MVPAVIEPLTFRAVRPMSISGSTEISSATSVTGRPIAGSTISAAKVAPPPTPATPAELRVTIATRVAIQRIQRVDTHGRCDHHREHCRVKSCTAVLADGGAERSRKAGDGLWNAQAAGLRLNA